LPSRNRHAALVLEDGRAFVGAALGADVLGQGEVVFNTAMTGYQEVLTDPSYAGQMVCMTYPLQGNYGVRDADAESARPWARALVVRWACPLPSHHSSEVSLDEYLRRWRVPGIADIDTRALTRHIRTHGALRANIWLWRQLARSIPALTPPRGCREGLTRRMGRPTSNSAATSTSTFRWITGSSPRPA